MKNWVETNIAVDNALNSSIMKKLIDTPQNEGTQMYVEGVVGVWSFKAYEVFDKEWIDSSSEELGVEINNALIFNRKAKYQHAGAHIDINSDDFGALHPVNYSLNWVLEPDTNPMVWYKPWWDAEDLEQCKLAVRGKIPFPGLEGEVVGDGSLKYQETPCKLLERDSEHCIRHDVATVCRTNIPHNVDMISDKERWCFTARNLGDYNHPVWSKVYKHLSLLYPTNC